MATRPIPASGLPNPAAPAARPYPGRMIAQGEKDKALVKTIQARLNAKGCGPLEVDGDFGAKTRNAVRLFQARFPDLNGQSLGVDGVVGSLTWASLFHTREASLPPAIRSLPARALAIAAGQVGVMERPPGSNRGPEVDVYLRATGLNPAAGSFAWCAAFIYWCFGEALHNRETNPIIKTAGVLQHWNQALRKGTPKVLAAEALENPALVKPGFIFILASGGGFGHSGLVEAVDAGIMTTIEGNTNDTGGREGVGVFRRSRRMGEINRGFLDYA